MWQAPARFCQLYDRDADLQDFEIAPSLVQSDPDRDAYRACPCARPCRRELRLTAVRAPAHDSGHLELISHCAVAVARTRRLPDYVCCLQSMHDDGLARETHGHCEDARLPGRAQTPNVDLRTVLVGARRKYLLTQLAISILFVLIGCCHCERTPRQAVLQS